ncbi:spore coat protein U-like protein [Sphingomonas sp. PvP018]|nr:spore coat protein U-like protein [Sphingomonas sp. PvP018]
MPVMVSLRLFFALVVLSIVTGPAFAACTTSSGALTFSPVSSYDVRGGTVPQVAGSAGLSCTGSVLTLIGGNSARATITSLNQFRLVKGADAIAYQVSADASGTTPFTQGSTVNYMSGSLLAVQGGGSSFTTPLFARLTAAPNVAAGTYSDTLTVQWDYSVCNGLNVLGVVCTGYDSGKVVVTLQVTLVVGNDCKITAPDLSFGSAALVTQFGPVTSAVQIDCTRDAVYRIGFTPGGAGTGAAWRQMTSGAGATLQYQIYHADGVTVWNEANPLTGASPGTGSLTPVRTYPYVARINQAQVTPTAGSYQDTVSVVVTF